MGRSWIYVNILTQKYYDEESMDKNYLMGF